MLLTALALAAPLAGSLAGSLAWPTQGGTTAPNVLFVIADDLTLEALSVYGNTHVHTPNVDRLAQRGLVFDRAYCQFPVCTASRASMLSGLYTSQLVGSNGSFTNLDSVLGPRSTMPEHFRLNGYTSARVSKLYHMRVPGDITSGASGSDHAPSWDTAYNVTAPEWMTPGVAGHYTNETLSFNPNLHYGLGFGTAFYAVAGSLSGTEQADWIAADQAIARLDALQNEPFFLAVGFVRPHVPLVAPAAEFARYNPLQLDLAQSVPNDLADIPPAGIFWHENARGPNNDGDRREVLRAYYAAVTFMDQQLGRVLDRLDQLGLTDETIVIFTSDHGYHLGEHTFWQKLSLHEESARVPLIIAGPGITPGRTDALAELLDLYPTLADLTGIGVPAHCSGTTLRGVLDGTSTTVRNGAVSMIGNGVLWRTSDWSYIRYSNQSEELYDMRPVPAGGDPLQFTNLASDPAHSTILQQLRDELDARLDAIEEGPGELFCAGDGTGALCPCFFFGQAGEGCLNSTGAGARIHGVGNANVAFDTLSITISGGPPGNAGLLFSGLSPTSMPLGDGILCTLVQVRHPVHTFDASGATTYTGLSTSALAGSTVYYQFAFRDLGPCGGAFNLSSGWQTTWH